MENYLNSEQPRRVDVALMWVRRMIGMGITLLLIVAVIMAAIGTMQAINHRQAPDNVDIVRRANLCRGHGSVTEIAPGVYRVVCQ